MAFSKSGVSKVAWPMRLGLIMASSPFRPRIHLYHFFQCTELMRNAIGDEFKGYSPGPGQKRCVILLRSTHPTLRLSSTYTLDKIEIFGESLREQHRTHGSKRTWTGTNSRRTQHPRDTV